MNAKSILEPSVKSFLSPEDVQTLKETMACASKLVKKVNSSELVGVWDRVVGVERSIQKHIPQNEAIRAELDEQQRKLADAEAALNEVKQAYSHAYHNHQRTADVESKIFGIDVSEASELTTICLADYEKYLKEFEERILSKQRILRSLK